MMRFNYILVSYLLYFLSVLQIDSIEGRRCNHVEDGGRNRKCIKITHCPILFNSFKFDQLDTVRRLQRLTCGFHGETPKVCCPVESIREDIELDPQRVIKVFSNLERSKTVQLHPNFKLFPTLLNCSLTRVADKIVGGTDVPISTYPWLVRIGYKGEHFCKVLRTGAIVYGCGGTVINEFYILTAAHCALVGNSLVPYRIRLAEHDTRQNPDCFGTSQDDCVYVVDGLIDKVIIHPGYNLENGTDKQNDVALIRLASPLNFDSSMSIQPICLPFVQEYGLQDWPVSFKEGTKLTIAGWGKQKWNKAKGSDILQDVQIPLVSNQKCSTMYSQVSSLEITEKQMCAGGELNKDSCDGDSGSSLMWLHRESKISPEAKLFQIGIVSFGPLRCGSLSLPGVFTRVSGYLKFILDSVEP